MNTLERTVALDGGVGPPKRATPPPMAHPARTRTCATCRWYQQPWEHLPGKGVCGQFGQAFVDHKGRHLFQETTAGDTCGFQEPREGAT